MSALHKPVQILLIDGSSYLYRAYYSLKPLHTPDGKTVQAVYSFCRMLAKMLREFKPDHIALIWDSKGPNERKQMYADYKATRQAAPSDMTEQRELIQEFARTIGMSQVAEQGVEADDLIASAAQQFAHQGHQVIIFSSDKDLLQLLNSNIKVYDPFKEQFVTREDAESKFGFSLEKLAMYYALIGDSSDNIPGVAGIGPKTAADLCRQFASIEDLYARLAEVSKDRTRTLLQTHEQDARLSYELFKLRIRPIALTVDQVVFNAENWKVATPIFQRLGFKSFLSKEEAEATQTSPNGVTITSINSHDYEWVCVTTEAQLNELVSEIEHHKTFGLDTETNGLGHHEMELVGLSISCRKGRGYYVPLAHITSELQLPLVLVHQRLQPYLRDNKYQLVMHNAKFDIEVLNRAGFTVDNLVFDTLVAASLVTPDWQRIGLKSLSEFFFAERMESFADVVTAHKYTKFSEVPHGQAVSYAAADAHQTLRLYHELMPLLEQHQQMELFTKIELPIVSVLAAIEQAGMKINTELLAQIDQKLTVEIRDIDATIHSYVGFLPGAFNLNSPRQVADLLFTKLNLPPQRKSSKDGGYSTDADVLEALKPLHPVVGLLLRYRELFKLKSTYVSALPGYVSPVDGRIHSSFSQTSAATGRLASFEPNLQNIPLQYEEPTIRSAFIPEPGNVFISTDYSQIELRVLAYLSQDEILLQAFKEDHDIHRETAAYLFEVPSEEVTSEQRQIGKRINFSVLYGMTPYGLSKDLGISMGEAKKYIDRYFARYPKVAHWMEEAVEEAKKFGYVTTHWGRRRLVPQIHEKNKHLYEQARRVAINTKAQGTAAEIMKIGMIKVHKLLTEHYPQAKLVLQIHDELLVEAPAGIAQELAPKLRQELELVAHWNVALKVSERVGNNWQEVTK